MVRFELLANNYFKEDPDYKPRVELICKGGKYEYADFNPGVRLGRPDYPGFWGQPKMEVMVRIDKSHDHKGWNWVRRNQGDCSRQIIAVQVNDDQRVVIY